MINNPENPKFDRSNLKQSSMKKTVLLKLSTVLVLVIFWHSAAWSQISYGGVPPSFEHPSVSIMAAEVELNAPDMDAIEFEDRLASDSESSDPLRMGVSVRAGLNMTNSGLWTQLDDGSKVWRLKMHVPGALALGVYYDRFYLPEGSRLFLYNESRNQLLGAYTFMNNPESGLFANEFVQGDVVYLEYHQESTVTEQAVIQISEIAYAYRHIAFVERETDGVRSLWCMINVACEEGDDWDDQIRSVARISVKIGFNFYWCSGALINNTNNDRTPYFLTASHCGGSASASDLNQWIFYFNFQAPTCQGTSSGSNTITGCQLKARDNSQGDNGSDFLLVQFNSSVPNFYNVYFSGWNRTNVTVDMGNGVSIHHPAGDIKKISTYIVPLVSSTAWNGLQSHWRVNWANTTNGRSIVEGGSSGSPIFDSNGLIVGDLTGGYTYNSCENPSPAFYGKIWYSWDQNGSTPATRLRDWLDPDNTGIEKLPGVNWQNTPPVANFEAAETTVEQGEGAYFSDLSEPGILSWEWTFTGGQPETSADENPGPIIYTQTGSYTVSLTVTNADGTDTETKVNYITVSPAAPPVADFEASQTNISQGGQVDFMDLSEGNPFEWYWEFEGGTPAVSNEQNPAVTYQDAGTFNVSLRVVGYGGEDTKIVEDYINVSPVTLPVADFTADQTQIMQGSTVNFTDLSSGTPNYWYWEFEGATPSFSEAQNPQGILYPDGGAFNVSLTVVNNYGIHTKTIEDFIIVNWVGLNEQNESGLSLYPNPTKGVVYVRNFGHFNSEVIINVINSTGFQVYQERVNLTGEHAIDLTALENGMYLIVVNDKGLAYTKRVSLNR
jgi:lysyl endopeptidase